MAMNQDIYEKTRRLVQALNIFVVHVFIYFISNISLALFTFRDISHRWPWLFLIVIWAVGLIYHGIRVYGLDPFSGKRKPGLLSLFLNSLGV